MSDSARSPALIAGWILGIAVTLTAFPSAALRTASMQLPEGFSARTERLEASGYGGYNRGEYRLGDYSGEFTRIESRWAVFDPLYSRNRAKSSFSLRGPSIDEAIAAECEMKRGNVTVGVVTFDSDKMTYQCAFTAGAAPLAASFVLGEKKREGMRARLMARSDREGYAEINGVSITIRSVHNYEGSRLQSAAPAGYLLEVDGIAIGGIELTDVDPTFFLPTASSEEVRRSVLVSAMALSVLRDPENSDLGD